MDRAAAEEASIADVTGCTVEAGIEDWGLQQLTRVVVTRPDQRAGAGLRFCFAEEGLRD